ncbi:hypothetical protein T4E_601 [Trichinella pseudospiralis]|uniref:CCHC-type domain-containing protein n=1 Tax=Trichinella pseudospiralis TaxID=6337 RepID=A0A0V0XHT3_TRIPS|nr:hypothetical protein T4E_601 [Trichinella pseudospiralis]
MRLTISGAAVGHANDRVAAGKQCVGVAESGSTAAAAEERTAAALEEEDALVLRVDCRQDIEKLVNEFCRMLTRSVQPKQPRTRTANLPPQRLADTVCWNCGRGGQYRRSCPFSKARGERRPSSTPGEQREYQVGCRAFSLSCAFATLNGYYVVISWLCSHLSNQNEIVSALDCACYLPKKRESSADPQEQELFRRVCYTFGAMSREHSDGFLVRDSPLRSRNSLTEVVEILERLLCEN